MFDLKDDDFASQLRNLRLGLSTKGMSPQIVQSSTPITWLVVLVIYNLLPQLFIKRRFVMFTLLISGPKKPENNIDVYLAPLINDLKIL